MRYVHLLSVLVVIVVGCDAILGLDDDYHVRTDVPTGGSGGAGGGAGGGDVGPGGGGTGGVGGESCESLCTAACQSCDVAGSEGTCAANPYGDIDPACGFDNDICDGGGSCTWVMPFASATEKTILASAASGDFFVIAGIFVGTVDFGDGPLTTNGTDPDVFIAVFEGDGTLVGSTHLPTVGGSERSVTGIDVTDDGLVYMVGVVPPGGSFDGSVPGNETHPYIYRWDPKGIVGSIARVVPGPNVGATTTLERVAVDVAHDRLIVAGTNDQPFILLASPCTIQNSDDVRNGFLAALSLDLDACTWSTTWGTRAHDDLEALAVDDEGFAVVAGSFANSVVADPLAIAGRTLGGQGDHGTDIYVAKLWPANTRPIVNKIWAWAFYGNDFSNDHVQDVATDAAGNVILTGLHTGPQLVREDELGAELVVGQLSTGRHLFVVRLDSLDGTHHDNPQSFLLSSNFDPQTNVVSTQSGVAIGGALHGGMTVGTTETGDGNAEDVWLFALHLDGDDFTSTWMRQHHAGDGGLSAHMAFGRPLAGSSPIETLYLSASISQTIMLQGGTSFVPEGEDLLILAYRP